MATIHVELTGNDTTGNGSSGAPYLTVQKGVDVARAGDTILVGAGTFSEGVRMVDWAGSSGSPITLDGQNVATLGAINLEKPYLIFQNFTVKGGMSIGNGLLYFGQNGDFCLVQNCIFDGEYRLELVRPVRWQFPDSVGAPWGKAGSDNRITNNVFKQFAGEVVFKIYGSRNVITQNQCMDVDNTDWLHLQGSDNVVSYNTFTNEFYSGANANHADFVQIFGDSGTGTLQASVNNLIEGNIVNGMAEVGQLGNLTDDSYADPADGVVYNRDLLLRNNIFMNIASKISIAMPGVRFYNNVFYKCATNVDNGGPILIYGDVGTIGKGHRGECINNVFIDCGVAGDTRKNGSGWYTFDTTLTDCRADYNYVGKDGYQAMVDVDALHRMVGASGGWDKYSWWEDHGFNGGDPQLADVVNGDFHPLAGSFLLDAGLSLADVTEDIDGTLRGASPDIGPYEGSVDPPPPAGGLVSTVISGRVASSGKVTFA